MTHALSEDDIYRTSSQFRLWSFSAASLTAQRETTHRLALERARRYTNPADSNLDLLTADDELRLVQRYSEQIRSTADHFKWPINVKATAVQYLRRFYLSNSCMTYPPKEIYKTVLFLACKTESTHMTLSEYARRISTDPEKVLAAEYKVMQALRFTLDVRQPFRGLKGVLMELLNMAEGVGAEESDAEATLKQLPAPLESNTSQWRRPAGSIERKHVQDRIQAAYAAARTLLDAPALLTDVYFLYTPSQLLLAALQLADEPLTSFYLSTKPLGSLREKILATISACADVLSSFDQSQVLTKDERAELEEKLDRCRDPGTRDLVKAFAAMRQGDDDSTKAEEKAKRRKVEREKNMQEGDALFGPSLSVNG